MELADLLAKKAELNFILRYDTKVAGTILERSLALKLLVYRPRVYIIKINDNQVIAEFNLIVTLG